LNISGLYNYILLDPEPVLDCPKEIHEWFEETGFSKLLLRLGVLLAFTST